MIFTKAGEAGWKSIIPIWNILILLKIVGREWWWIILFLIPIVGFIVWIIVALDLAKGFGRGTGFGDRADLPDPDLRADPRLRQRHVQGAPARGRVARTPPEPGPPVASAAERHGPGGPAGLQNLCGVVTPRSVGSTPAPLRSLSFLPGDRSEAVTVAVPMRALA